MDSRTRNLFAVALVLVIAVGGGAAILLSENPPGFGNVSEAASIDGVIIGVNSEGLDRVRAFTLRTADGRALEFLVGTVYEGFPPGHLVEHQATAQPVRVWYQMDGEARVAIRLEDAP